MAVDENVEEGEVYELKVDAKGTHGEGIGKLGNLVVFVNNARTRIGNIYDIKVTKVHRTFALAELRKSKKQIIGNGSILEL
jgi:predicted RNA-binding protein with TRAM domain